jgi:hypothetical protein
MPLQNSAENTASCSRVGIEESLASKQRVRAYCCHDVDSSPDPPPGGCPRALVGRKPASQAHQFCSQPHMIITCEARDAAGMVVGTWGRKARARRWPAARSPPSHHCPPYDHGIDVLATKDPTHRPFPPILFLPLPFLGARESSSTAHSARSPLEKGLKPRASSVAPPAAHTPRAQSPYHESARYIHKGSALGLVQSGLERRQFLRPSPFRLC